MIKFFRRIRQRLVAENKFSKYLFYAIGEIILVVIGILIALSINVWNDDRIAKNNIQDYYERLIPEIEQVIASSKNFIKHRDTLIQKNTKLLKIINSKNADSLAANKKLLGATATSWEIIVNMPLIEEFLNQNYLSKVESDSLKFHFTQINSLLETVVSYNNGITTQYLNTIEPFFNKHINYSDVALKVYESSIVTGGPETDFSALINNLEFWNIVTFKLELLQSETGFENYLISFFESLLELLEKEINHI